MKKHFVLTSFFTLCVVLLCMMACASAEDLDNPEKPVKTTVIEISKYGHAVLDIRTADFIDDGYEFGDVVCVRFGSQELEMPFYDEYYSIPGDMMILGESSEQNIMLCVNYGDFSEATGIKNGDTVEITMVEKAGMSAFKEHSEMKYSNDRADYSDDAVFANFRAVTAGAIGDGKLYRSASPINSKYGRADYANDLMEEANVATILNLSDSEEDIAQYFGMSDFDSEYYRSLYEQGNVIVQNLSNNFFSDEFTVDLINGLKLLAQKDAPYCIHCSEGINRVGFAAAILEALMDAELQEIIDDYMLSFYNIYGVNQENEPEKYKAALNNFMEMMLYVTGADSVEALEQTDLESAVTAHLMDNGMSEDDISALKSKLS